MEALEGKRWDASLEYGVLKSCRTMIHPSFFEHSSTLQILDLSRTNIQSVPPFISMLGSLVKLTLQECSMLVELPPEIGTLSNLIIFDLEGTEIMYLPKEMGNLTNLQCLRVSLCEYADEYIGRNGIENVIPRTILSKLSKLEELSIHVNPDAKWWEVELLEAILEKLHLLTCLKILKLYLPTAQTLLYFLRLHSCQPPIYSTLRDFSLKIGHGEQLTSCLKSNLVKCFETLEKCLKYENGEDITDDIKELIGYAKALFVCRHWTIEKLSIFDISRLKYCLLAECNEMHTIVDADELQGDKSVAHNNVVREAFASLEYLAIHSMKKLQSIWKGPLSRDSFSCLQVLALHTCPELTTVFTEGMLYGLHSLTSLIVEDCAKVHSLVSRGSTHENYGPLFPNLRRILVLDLPELVSISNGVCIAPHLDTLLIFNCLKLDYLSPMELSRDVKVIKGETEWWDALKSVEVEYSSAFVPLERDGELMNQLAEATNSLKHFHRLKSRGEAASISSSTFVPPDSQLFPAQVYETKKDLDWGLFVQYLKYQKPPVSLSQCKSGHVIKFLKYLNKFGDIRVHMEGCVLFGQPYPSATCFCPLREAWGTLEDIVTRLHASYAENGMPEMNPFSSRDIESYLNQVRKSQEIALGVPCKKPEFSILTVEEKSEFGCISPIILSPMKGMINSGGQGGNSTGTIIEASTKLPVPVQEAIGIISKWNSNAERKNQDNDTVGLDWYLEAIDRIHYWLNSAAATDDLSMAANAMELAMHRLTDEFRTMLQVNCISKEHGSSDSYHELQEDDYVESYELSPKLISDLRNMAVRATSDEHIQTLVAIYISERGKFIRSRCQQFIFHKWSRNGAQRFHWELLESLIVKWIKLVKIYLEGLFASEKQWCEHIFQGLGTNIGDICYELIIHFYETQVFNIVYALSYCYPPPDRLFTILDLYHTLDRFLSEMCFVAKPWELNHVTHLLHLLANKITSNLSKFEMTLLYHESSVIFVGPVEPLPIYVLSYLYKLCEHMHAFKKISLPKLPSIDEDDLTSIYYEEFEGRSELPCHVIWIIMRLVDNLEGQAKLCADGSAGYFFAAKNIHYIVQKIEGRPELMEVIGHDYLGKLIQKRDQKVKYLMLELEKVGAVRDDLKSDNQLPKKSFERGSSSGWSSGVPLPNGDVIGFEDQVNDLKRMVLKESIVVVSGAGGCGKTTLVKMLCHDPEIKEQFGRNIYFVTISHTPDLNGTIKRLLQKNHQGQLDFNSDEDATHQWGSFLSENMSEEILLVLDDVWSDSIVMNFKFKSPGYRILVTSRFIFTQFKTYELQPLKDQHATKLFRSSALSENESEKNDGRNDLVDKLVKCCKNHPLALNVIGGLLKGKPIARWRNLFSELSKRKQSVWVEHDLILHSLEKTVHQFKDQPEIKQCYMDLGSFPEDQKIAATALMDMWVHLYKHGEDGLATQNILLELSFRNLATLLPIRQHFPTAYHCEDESVMQHDMLRALAILLSSKEPIELRERLIINPGEPDLPQIPETVNARLLSISTDERNSSIWNNIQVPRVEVFVCNFLTKTHPLPQFMHRMDKLKVLIITNYGYRFSELENFPPAHHLSCLTTIRLDHISISSIITSILDLENLQKLSLIMCKIGDSFNERTVVNHNKLSSLLELDIDSCFDLVTFPVMLCNLVHLTKLSITNCHELTSLSEGFGNLTNLEVLRLASCSILTTLPRSFKNLEKLKILGINDCSSLRKLPMEIGELGCLRTIHMRGCMGLEKLPSSVENLSSLEVVCDVEISLLWSNHPDVKLRVVDEDKLGTFMKIIAT